MKQVLLFFSLLLLAATANAQFASAPAFPGAEGYGRYVTGGRGGRVIHVTNLNDTGVGSFRNAIQASGPRIIVFDVSGTIQLKSRVDINNGDITILGQTAPGDGICLANYALNIKSNNVIIRYIRCRMGDYDTSDSNESDAMSCSNHDNGIKTGIIIDHCSVSWSIDECASFYGNRDFTFQWNFVTESMRNSGHSKGAHGYGGIWGGERASFHHNLLAHHDSRNARLDHDYVSTLKGPIDYVNNAIYNWGGNNTYGGESVKGSGFRKVNFIGNYYKPGAATKGAKSQLINATSYCENCAGKGNGANVEPAHLYLKDNVITSSADVTANNWKGVIPDSKNQVDVNTLRSDVPFTSGEARFDYNTISIQPAAISFKKVTNYGGCSFARDSHDQRIAYEAETGTYTYSGSVSGTKGIIDKPSDVGGYPMLSTYNQLTDTDNDGMPDVWEEANGLNIYDANDATKISLDKRGYYTNIEIYANSIVEDEIKAQRTDATETFEEYYPECKRIKIVTEEKVIKTGNITWNLSSVEGIEKLYQINAEIDENIADDIDVADIDLNSDFSISGIATDTQNMTGIQLKNNTAFNANATVKCTIAPYSPYALRLNKAEFYAGKNGTNTACTVNAVWANKAASSVLAPGIDLPRITEGNEPKNALYHFTNDEIKCESAGEDNTLTISFNGIPSGKYAVIGNTSLNVSLTEKTSRIEILDPTGIQSVSTDSSKAIKPRKQISNGQLVIKTANGTYSVSGARLK